MALNMKQKAFALEYLKHKNATKAYMTVYETSQSTAKSASSRLMSYPEMRAFLKEREAHIHAAVEKEIQYSKKESFAYLCDVQKSAFEVSPKPDFTAILKAEELKGKLIGLYDKGPEIKEIPPVEVIIKK